MTLVTCNCLWCVQGKSHPTGKYHDVWEETSPVLLVAESLDPRDYILVECCRVCGHRQQKAQ